MEDICRFQLGDEVTIWIGKYSGRVGRVVRLEWGKTRWWITVEIEGERANYEQSELEFVG